MGVKPTIVNDLLRFLCFISFYCKTKKKTGRAGRSVNCCDDGNPENPDGLTSQQEARAVTFLMRDRSSVKFAMRVVTGADCGDLTETGEYTDADVATADCASSVGGLAERPDQRRDLFGKPDRLSHGNPVAAPYTEHDERAP